MLNFSLLCYITCCDVILKSIYYLLIISKLFANDVLITYLNFRFDVFKNDCFLFVLLHFTLCLQCSIENITENC